MKNEILNAILLFVYYLLVLVCTIVDTKSKIKTALYYLLVIIHFALILGFATQHLFRSELTLSELSFSVITLSSFFLLWCLLVIEKLRFSSFSINILLQHMMLVFLLLSNNVLMGVLLFSASNFLSMTGHDEKNVKRDNYLFFLDYKNTFTSAIFILFCLFSYLGSESLQFFMLQKNMTYSVISLAFLVVLFFEQLGIFPFHGKQLSFADHMTRSEILGKIMVVDLLKFCFLLNLLRGTLAAFDLIFLSYFKEVIVIWMLVSGVYHLISALGEKNFKHLLIKLSLISATACGISITLPKELSYKASLSWYIASSLILTGMLLLVTKYVQEYNKTSQIFKTVFKNRYDLFPFIVMSAGIIALPLTIGFSGRFELIHQLLSYNVLATICLIVILFLAATYYIYLFTKNGLMGQNEISDATFLNCDSSVFTNYLFSIIIIVCGCYLDLMYVKIL